MKVNFQLLNAQETRRIFTANANGAANNNEVEEQLREICNIPLTKSELKDVGRSNLNKFAIRRGLVPDDYKNIGEITEALLKHSY